MPVHVRRDRQIGHGPGDPQSGVLVESVVDPGVEPRRADGSFFSERLDRDGSTTIWRSSVSEAPTLYAHVGKECKLVSIDRAADRVVCQAYREESDACVVTRP